MCQIRAYMRAFGLSQEEVDRISITDPGKIAMTASAVLSA